MSFDYGSVFTEIEKNKDIVDVTKFMNMVIDLCQSMEPDESWEIFRTLPYQVESALLSTHVVTVMEQEPVSIEDKGFWFGINNPELATGEATAGIYFSVSSKYDAEEDENDWACEAEYYPEDGDFESQVMCELYRLAYTETDLENKAEYSLCLAYGLKLAQEAMSTYKAKNQNKKVGFAVGFDSGDFINLGWM